MNFDMETITRYVLIEKAPIVVRTHAINGRRIINYIFHVRNCKNYEEFTEASAITNFKNYYIITNCISIIDDSVLTNAVGQIIPKKHCEKIL